MTAENLTRRADAVQRAQRAWTLRVAGATWPQIAQAIGYKHDTNAIRAVRRYLGSVPKVDVEAQRELWRHRHELLWGQAQAQIRERVPGSLRAGVAVARSASQLDGLDAPSRVEVYRPDSEEFLRTIGELRAIYQRGAAAEADIFEIEAEVLEGS